MRNTRRVPGRNDPCRCESGRRYKRCHLKTDAEKLETEDAAALHEAGHVVAAHALGFRVVRVVLGDFVVPVGPGNPHNRPAIAAGGVFVEPHLAAEVKSRHLAGQTFTSEQRDWMLSRCVIQLSGLYPELPLHTDLERARLGAVGDLAEFADIAEMLGQGVGQHGESMVAPSFQVAAEDAVAEILDTLATNVLHLGDLFNANRGDWREDMIQGALDSFGSRRGSHLYVLDAMRDEVT